MAVGIADGHKHSVLTFRIKVTRCDRYCNSILVRVSLNLFLNWYSLRMHLQNCKHLLVVVYDEVGGLHLDT